MKNLKSKMKTWRGLALSKAKGFTLIELLIVIALIGVLAVAILAALDPIEQLRKGRDTARKSDATELLNAMERFYASYQCYPWDNTAANPCSAGGTVLATVIPGFGVGGNVADLITRNELKPEFVNRRSITSSELCISANAQLQAAVCFEPESNAGRNGGLGALYDTGERTTAGNSCTTSTYGVPDACGTAGGCFICVPQ